MNNFNHSLSPDTQAILLLCGHFGKKTAGYIEPLTPSEYAWLAQQLQAQNMRPADLLDTASTLTIKHWEKQEYPIYDRQLLKMFHMHNDSIASNLFRDLIGNDEVKERTTR